MRSSKLVLACVVVLTPSQTHAWGDLGHQIICEIAFQELKRPALTNVKLLLRNDEEFKLFSKACTWPDHPRIRAQEHYVNLQRDAASIGTDPCPVSSRCVVTAVLNDMRDLALTDDQSDQLRLLKSLSHWVGDIHQPMHVSFSENKGANKIHAGAPCNTNLHAVWDTCVIKEAIGRGAKSVADDLRSEITDAQRQTWTTSQLDKKAVVGWANESFRITVHPSLKYCVMEDGVCRYSAHDVIFAGSVKDVKADKAYLKNHAVVVRSRLKMAAIRLAYLLNTIWL